MTDAEIAAFSNAVTALPEGTSKGSAQGHRYVVTKTLFNKGRSVKVAAEELAGSDYISMNYYFLSNGPLLKPCEMSVAKVVTFVLRFVPDQEEA